MTPFPTITTERLILRQITPADAQAMYEYLSNQEVTKQMASNPTNHLKPLQMKRFAGMIPFAKLKQASAGGLH